ncbi:MAG: alcohol dehydrogenase catalytic domain-containing protein, partial [Clostridiales bacterium]|nr:alcohol dehydrogenase catalytic domain-containing protein [Clostridiales bacterium]
MKVLMYHGPRNMRIEDVSEVMPANNEVKIKVLYSSICGSDVHGYTGASGRRIPPMYMGHEMSGEVYAIGEEVKGISVGQRVTVQPITFCGKCPMCLAGKVNICENRRGLGVMNVNGTFAEYICVDQSQVFPFSEKLDPVVASLIEPTAVTYHA